MTSSAMVGSVAMVALLLWLAGCGGGDSSAATQATDTTPSADVQGQDGDSSKGKTSTAGTAAANGKGSSSKGQNSSPGGQGSGSSTDGKGQASPAAQPEGERVPSPTAKQRANATLADLTLKSPSLQGQGAVPVLPATYTCDGEDTWPSLSWDGVRSGSAELALLLVNTQPVNEQLFFDWAVAGLDPGLTSIESGKLPSGAVVGRNGSGKTGYSLCPTAGTSETYFFTLYALPKRLGMKSGFDPLALREAALDASHNSGLLPVSYSRG